MTALPSQVELRELLRRQDSIKGQLNAHKDLSERLKGVIQARKAGNARMDLPVESGNGTGFTSEGVVEDTKDIIVSSGLEDVWLDLPVESAQTFVQKRIAILEKRAADLEKPIAKLKEEHALVAKTLRDAFQLPDEPEMTA